MRVLIVEDGLEKAAAVKTVLRENGLLDAEIHHVSDGRSARAAMRSEQFDLAIVDLVLPVREGEEPRRLGGLDLIREVRGRDLYWVPLQFVVLSAFGDVIEEAGADLADEVLLVLRYEERAAAWQDRLSRQLNHVRSVLDQGLRHRPIRADVCVVTALREPELSAVLGLPWGWEEVEVLGDGTLYYRGHAPASNGGTLSIVAASCSRMGMVASAILATKMCVHFAPQILATCGILASTTAEIGFGDVVVADPSWNYESGKRMQDEESGIASFKAAPDHHALDPWLRERCAALSTDGAVLDSIRRSFQGVLPPTALSMHLGPVASGSSVVTDDTYLKDAKGQHRKLIGVEMETYGIFAAAHEAPLPRPLAISVKSVSDYANAAKDDDFQLYASYTSASVLQQLIERYVSAR